MLNKYLWEEGSKEGWEALNEVVRQSSPALAWPNPPFPVVRWSLVIKCCPGPPYPAGPAQTAPPLHSLGFPCPSRVDHSGLQLHIGFSIIAFTQLD